MMMIRCTYYSYCACSYPSTSTALDFHVEVQDAAYDAYAVDGEAWTISVDAGFDVAINAAADVVAAY